MRKTLLSLAAVAALTLSSSAFAQMYAGFGFGMTKLVDDCAGTSSCDTTDTGGKIFGGYKFSPQWAGELVYLNFGKATASSGGVTAEIKSTGWGGGVAFSGDFSPQWKGVARLGLASVKADVTGAFGGSSVSDSSSKTQAYYGFGVSYALTKQVSVDGAFDGSRVEYGGGASNLRLFSLGMTYSF